MRHQDLQCVSRIRQSDVTERRGIKVGSGQRPGQAARFRTDLTPKFGSWLLVAIVYALCAIALFLLVGFVGALNEQVHLAGLLSHPVPRASSDITVKTADLALELNVRGWLLASTTLLTVLFGGTVFLRYARRLERLLVQRAAEIDEIDKSRRLFFAKASHEFRTPVTVIRGEAQMALEDHSEDVAALNNALRHVVANSIFLEHRLEEMIGLARTADGKLHLESQKVDLRDVVADAVHDAGWFARSVDVDLDLTLPAEPVFVMGDGVWLKRAALALVENAVKFSPLDGRITIALTLKDAFAKVEVTDRGPGVVWDELPLIFEAYYQTSLGRDRGGSGLGLAMTRWVAEQHGGTARAENLGPPNNSCGCAVSFTVAREAGP